MIWFKLLKKLLVILQSEISPVQIAWGAALGLVLGMAPFSALHTYLIFILILLLNVNIGSAMLAAAVFAIVGLITDPIADSVGYYFLVNVPALQPLWEKLYNMPLVPFTRFYNTVVLGNFIISLVLLVPIFFFALWFVKYYRANLREKVSKWKIVKLLGASSVYSIYDKVQ
jgi:uncharacterized protein (TIGR03546 family)